MRLVSLCSAVGIAALTVTISAGAASAAPAHHASRLQSRHAVSHVTRHAALSTTRHTIRRVDHWYGERHGASQVLAATQARVKRLSASVATSTALLPADAAALGTVLAADLTQLQADQTAVSQATTRQQIRNALASAVRTGQGAHLAYELVAAADRLQGAATELNTSATTVSDGAAALPAGTDTTSVTGPLADLATQTASVPTSAQAAVAAALAIPAAPTGADLWTAGRTAGIQLGTAWKALAAAKADLGKAKDALTTLQAAGTTATP